MELTIVSGDQVDVLGPGALHRRELWAVQNIHQRALENERDPESGARVAVAMCHRYPIVKAEQGGMDYVEVRKGAERVTEDGEILSGRAFYANAMKCGSGWACPTCADRLMQLRQAELRELENGTTRRWMMTLTAHHTIDDPLAKTLDGLGEAFRLMADRRAFQRYRRDECEGYVRSTEVTRGRRGWHPHFHVLLLSNTSPQEFGDMWRSCLSKVGLYGEEAAFHVTESYDAAEYLAKMGYERRWDTSKELAARPKKKKSSRSIWEIKSGDLIREHYWATKGKSRIRWSRGLKEDFGLKDMTDAELAAELLDEERDSDLVIYVRAQSFLRLAELGLRAQLLEAAERGGLDGACEFMREHKL